MLLVRALSSRAAAAGRPHQAAAARRLHVPMVAATATTLTSAGAWKGGGAPIVGGAGRVDAPALRHSSGGSSGSCNYSRDASAPHARRVKVVLLESIHPRAVEIFKSSNFEVCRLLHSVAPRVKDSLAWGRGPG